MHLSCNKTYSMSHSKCNSDFVQGLLRTLKLLRVSLNVIVIWSKLFMKYNYNYNYTRTKNVNYNYNYNYMKICN